MQGKRRDRVGHLLQMELSRLILHDVKDTRLGFVTVTHVDMSPDLKSACVFYSVLGNDESKKISQKILDKAAGFFQREIGRRLELRYTPKLIFKLDDSIERDIEIEQILHQIKKKEGPGA